MGTVIGFEDRAVARLRDRLGAAESARADLAAFARDHSGAVARIHEAALAAMAAADLPHLVHIVTQDWPVMLGVDAVALGLVVGDRAFRADAHGLSEFSRPVVDRMIANAGEVSMRAVGQGHPLFGADAASIRSELLVAVDAPRPMPYGLIAIGQKEPLEFDAAHGGELLLFLAATLGAMLRRCVTEDPTTN